MQKYFELVFGYEKKNHLYRNELYIRAQPDMGRQDLSPECSGS